MIIISHSFAKDIKICIVGGGGSNLTCTGYSSSELCEDFDNPSSQSCGTVGGETNCRVEWTNKIDGSATIEPDDTSFGNNQFSDKY